VVGLILHLAHKHYSWQILYCIITVAHNCLNHIKLIFILYYCLHSWGKKRAQFASHCLVHDYCIYLFIISSTSSQKEEIKANRAKRREQLSKLLDEARESMEDHTSGRRLLEDKELHTLERKIDAYERKLETMQGEMDEREVERVLQREKLRYERDAARREERRKRGSEL